jgi:uncharacterized protein (DUF2132 family)
MSRMSEQRANDPLHGVTLEQIVNRLVDQYGWRRLGERIDIRCFTSDPSVQSSLKFLRRTPWARRKVENLYLLALTGTKKRPAQPRRPARPTRAPRQRHAR